MKLRILSFILLIMLVLPFGLTGCLATYAQEDFVWPEAPDETLQVVSVGIDALGLSTIVGDRMANHGANQNRLVYVSSGAYLGAMVTPRHEHISDYHAYACLIRVNPDGTVDTLYKDFILGADSSTTVTVMADKNEDIWMYSGWQGNGQFMFKLWHYDVSEDRVTEYSTNQRLMIDDGFGYSVAMIDAENNKIVAMAPGGDVPGEMLWVQFDIEKKEWNQHQMVILPGRYCYLHAYPDGKGGVIVLDERAVLNQSVESNIPGMSVMEAIKTLRSHYQDANYMWDELHLHRIPDPTTSEFEDLIIEDATYDVENGIYPNTRNGYGDMFMGSDGYLHILYTSQCDGIAGFFMYHKIFDVSDGFEEIFFEEISYLYGRNTLYCARMYEDLEGNVYILAMPTCTDAMIEVWKATDDLCTDFELVHSEYLRGVDGATGNAFILANSRNNSTPSNIAHFSLAVLDSWYTFEIDLTPFAD